MASLLSPMLRRVSGVRAVAVVPRMVHGASPGVYQCASMRKMSCSAASSEARATRVRAPIPQVPNKKPMFIAAFLGMAAFWYVFSSHMNNRERLNSSVMRLVKSRVQEAPEVHALVGEPVVLERCITGDPWITGEVNPLKGKVDVSFRITGPRGAAAVYFTSVRPNPHAQFEVLRFLVVPDVDSSTAVSLLDARSV